ncbi:MAG: hypothetical protein WBA90_05520 [Albidovulum sp.]
MSSVEEFTMKSGRLQAVAGAAAISLLVAGSSAWANTVTFDALPDYFDVLDAGITGSPYVENGVTVTATTPGGVLASDYTPGAAHLDDSGTDFTSGLMFTMSSAFDAISFSLISLGYDFLDTPGPLSDNIVVTGFAGGTSIASASYTLSDIFLGTQSITLGRGFTALDALLIEIVYPTNTASCGAPCGHFDLDEVVLSSVAVAAVPLPASALMLIAAALGLFGIKAARRR